MSERQRIKDTAYWPDVKAILGAPPCPDCDRLRAENEALRAKQERTAAAYDDVCAENQNLREAALVAYEAIDAWRMARQPNVAAWSRVLDAAAKLRKAAGEDGGR